MFGKQKQLKTYLRQGDIIFKRLNEKPALKGFVKRPNKVVAEGEITGHSHTLHGSDQCYIYENPITKEEYICNEGKNVTIQHQEHKPFTLPEGSFKIVHELDYNAFQKSLEQSKD
jgi:hypothetical protein